MDTPLQLKEYFFPHVRVSADPGVSDDDSFNDNNFKAKVDVIKTVEGNDDYQVALSLSSFPESEENRTPYSVELVAVGFFKVSPKWDDPDKLLQVTAASILYAAAREFLITVTSRGPWGAIMLPATSFLAIYNAKQKPTDQEKDSSDQKGKKKKAEKS
jgi:preprotein translocase subunit SecB